MNGGQGFFPEMWDFKRSFIHNVRAEDSLPVPRKGCDIPNCPHLGEFKAPKSRYNLRDYYWFCIDHVREYNANWDFFKGMSAGEVENYIQKSTVWDRPTWRMTEAGQNEEKIREKVYAHFTRGESAFGEFSFSAGKDSAAEKEAQINIAQIPHPTVEALAVLGLAPPVDWNEVRGKYKSLAKKYHPDTNKDDKDAEEQLKKINLAYTILKLSYQHYKTLDE